ncbi:MAG TPA: hypothetical protein VHB77_09785 [Planctomycetaceae bacterium]|nr:hypothetical protein [Planctomycetaceae bacterium]
MNSLIQRITLLDLRRLIPFATWGAFLGLACWSWAVLMRGDVHPNPWPGLVLLAVLLIGSIASGIAMLGALVCRRDVWTSFRAFCRAILPLWLLGGHIGIIYSEALQRRVEISPVSLSILPLVIACGEGESWFRYSTRTEGEFVVLYHSGIDRAADRVAAADHYLSKLQKTLGKPVRTRLRWVKGGLLGRGGVSFGVFALTAPPTEELLDQLDRHELAHAMINQFVTHRARPPMVLVEGWAEAVSHANADELRSMAACDQDLAVTLADLMSPDWAPIDDGPVYTTGGAFVRQLLDEFGGEKFLQLYLTCRPRTSRADFERIYGTSLEEFEGKYREKLADYVFERRRRALLTNLPTADSVDENGWRKFVEDYFGPAGQRPFPSDFDVTTRTTWERLSEPDSTKRTMAARLAKRGAARLMITDTDLLAISASEAFLLTRTDREHPWKLRGGCSAMDKVQFWKMYQRFANEGIVTLDPVVPYSQIFSWERQKPCVTKFERNSVNGAERVIVQLESRSEQADAIPVEMEWVFDSNPVWHLTDRTEKHLIKGTQRTRTHFEYRFEMGRILRRVLQSDSFDEQGELAATGWTEIDVNPNSELKAAELESATYGVTSRSTQSFTAIRWAKALYFIVALMMALLSLPRRRQHRARSDQASIP